MFVVPSATESPSSLPISALLCIDEDAFDRLGRVLRYLTVGLVDQTVSLRLFSSDPRIDALRLGPVESHIHQPIVWPWTRRRIERVLGAVGSPAPTVVHALSGGSYRIATAIAEVYDADLVLQVTSLTDCEAIAQLDRERIRAFLPLSKPLLRVLEEQLRIPMERVELVRPGLLASRRVACFAREERITTILCTSDFQRNSGLERLVEAISLLRQRNHDMLVFLLGRGPQESALRRVVRDRGLSSCVAFAHPLGDPADAMESADIFVRPSADTALAVDTLQAMAVGMAVVALPSPVCDHLRGGETAFICTKPTAEDLAETIEKPLGDQASARQLAASAVEYVRTHHAMSGMAERTAAVYRKLALARATFPIKE